MSEQTLNKIITNKEHSFGAAVDSGMSKEDIMKKFSMTSDHYEKVLASLNKIRAREKR